MKRWYKKLIIFFGGLAGLVVAVALLTPWMNNWGATQDEIAAEFPGDELVPEPAVFLNRAVSINAAPEDIYPWIVQLDAKRGGWYSYDWLETHLINCPMTNADRIHPEWQNLEVGDLIDMCPNGVPPAYMVAQIFPNQAIVIGHQEDGEWVDLYQFVIVPQGDGTSRLILRTRTMMTGWLWSLIRPGAFIMERGMLLGIKERAEQLAAGGGPSSIGAVTPTPEIFNPLEPSPTLSDSDLPLTCQVTDLNVYIDRAAGFCFAYPVDFSLSNQPTDSPSLLGPEIGNSVESIRVTLSIEVTPIDPKISFDQQMTNILRGYSAVDPDSLYKEALMIGGEPAVLVHNVPVQLSWDILFVQHEDKMFCLMFWPSDVQEASSGLNDLSQTVLGSFAFLERTE